MLFNSQKAGERFDRIWKERILRFGLNDPGLLPGDIRSFFSYLPGASLWHLKGKDVWGRLERTAFLIVDLDGADTEQLPGLMEPQWDTNSYQEFKPMSKSEFEMRLVDLTFRKGGLQQLNKLDLENEYARHIRQTQELCSYPTDYIKKRRMNVSLDTLQSLGVDIEKMLIEIYGMNHMLNSTLLIVGTDSN